MKHLYRLLLCCACLAWLPAQSQNWRPFRPNGDVHAFQTPAADTVLTLRLDSAAVQGPDSVYYFNRVLKRAGSATWQKARNNQFGQQLRYNAAQRTYVLFWDGGSTSAFTLDMVLVLKPFVPVGTSWTSVNTNVGVPTTLLARGTALIDGVLDSVATFRLGSPTGITTTVVLSKSFGLVSAPADLRFSRPNPRMLTLARRPAPAGLSYYNPLALLDLQPGDELGYQIQNAVFMVSPCYEGHLLRRVVSRQLTADSIVYTFQEQSRTMNYNMPNCPNISGLVTSGVVVKRVAASRRTGQWRGPVLLLPLGSHLLTYAYALGSPGSNSLLFSYPIVGARPGVGCSGAATQLQENLYRRGTTAEYMPGLDWLSFQQASAAGVGVIRQLEHTLVYTRRTINGVVQTCGSRTNFSTLLPTKAAQQAPAFQLYPNPARESATLTLPAARTAATVRLLDGLSRIVREQQLAAGQTNATLSLQGLPAGMYVVEVRAAGAAPQRQRLQLQP